jgi:1-acyl-sn-glycerol-3-phosphate acyltransferase
MALTREAIARQARRWREVARAPLGADPLARRDAAFIEEEKALLGAVCDAFYAPEIDGIEQLPEGRALVVGTHNGGPLAPDMFSLMVGFWRHHGASRAAYGLAHDMVFKLPFLGKWIARLGAVPASQENARLLLEKDVAVLVYPGGDLDSYKPYRERHTVKFGGRKGWVRLALRTGAPIVPVVSVGAHEVIYVLSDGTRLAEGLGLKRRFRIEVLPVALALPFGLAVGPFAPYLPLPTKVRIRVLPPIAVPRGADDAATVDAIDADVRGIMQRALDELARDGGYGPRERLR